MRSNKVFILVGIGALLFSVMVFAQSLVNKPLFEAKSIKVVANDNFPQDLECEVFVGPKATPYFHVEGKQNQFRSAQIEFQNAGPIVSVVRKEGETNSYALYLFSEDTEGKVFGLFDLNMDGVWDVKRTPTRNQKNFILFDSQWVAVSRIDGLLSVKPIAEGQGVHYEFHGVWKLVK